MSFDLEPNILAEVVRRRLAASTSHINGYWLTTSAERDGYARVLRNEFEADPIIVSVLRDSRFTNPNAILADFVELICESREACESCLQGGGDRCGVVLLSRAELTVAQASSPVVMPAWFPIGGGETVSMVIEDLTWKADAPLTSPDMRVGELSELLLEVEGPLIDRVRSVADADHRKVNPLLDLLRRDSSESLDDILRAADEHRRGITTPTAYRPSLKEGASLISRCWGAVQGRSPDQLRTASAALARALDLPSAPENWHESLVTVIGRPSGGETDAQARFARNVLMTVAVACQLATAAAHSDDYGHYPIALLRSISYDLRRALADIEAVLGLADDHALE